MRHTTHIDRLAIRWRSIRYIQAIILWVAIGTVMAIIFGITTPVIAACFVLMVGVFLYLKPWKIDRDYVVRFVNSHYPELEYSAQLLDRDQNQLKGLERIQAEKINASMGQSQIQPHFGIWPTLALASVSLILLISLGIPTESSKPEVITLKPDQPETTHKSLGILKNEIIVTPPLYTGLPQKRETRNNITLPEGSNLTWELATTTNFQEARLIINNDTVSWDEERSELSHNFTASQDALINFVLLDKDDTEYRSDLITLEIVTDRSPQIFVEDKKEFQAFNWNENKTITVSATVRDDYGLSGVELVTTSSRGSGESVTFSEKRFPVELRRISRTDARIEYKFNLDSLEFLPGDELYYFIEARDNRRPQAKIGRSQTFFVQIRDTTTYEYLEAGKLGAEIMPEYFRSQRQIILDTEKLIAEKNEITREEFNERSNNIAFDQKALRLRYGQFMGDENEGADPPAEEEMNEEDHSHEDHDHEEEIDQIDSEAGTLENYLHDHGDPESASFFKVSLKAKLRAAIEEMWDSELHLRLYEPRKSLPFQYRALELIREIKNDARIYVHRIGFDPPPIRAEKRLSGDLNEIITPERSERKQSTDRWSELQLFVSGLNRNTGISSNPEKLSRLRQILRSLAIEDPKKFYEVLELTDELIRNPGPDDQMETKLKNQLIGLFPQRLEPVIQRSSYPSSLRSAVQSNSYD